MRSARVGSVHSAAMSSPTSARPVAVRSDARRAKMSQKSGGLNTAMNSIPFEKAMLRLPLRLTEKLRYDAITNCWIWTACTNGLGYGYLNPIKGEKRGTRRAHRIVYELLVEKIPTGLQCDHLCRNRLCVNPAHIDIVTAQENTLRGTGFAATNAKKTHCQNGHKLTGANLVITSAGSRQCKICLRFSQRRYDARKRLEERNHDNR